MSGLSKKHTVLKSLRVIVEMTSSPDKEQMLYALDHIIPSMINNYKWASKNGKKFKPESLIMIAIACLKCAQNRYHPDVS